MDTALLKKFAPQIRQKLLDEIALRLESLLTTDSLEHREESERIRVLQQEIARTSKDAVIRRGAYTWFNRLCALRFMDVQQYTPLGVVSPRENFTLPELLQQAKGGQIPEEFARHVDFPRIRDILAGKIPSFAPQQEAYRMLLHGACLYYAGLFPRMFHDTRDYLFLFMPRDLVSEKSVLAEIRQVLTPENCRNVEVLGWLYQFYIAERKDQVYAGFRKNKKAAPEDIPPATQLFTPHWIVRYLVENSLGRLWMQNRPDSKLITKMDYWVSNSGKWEVGSGKLEAKAEASGEGKHCGCAQLPGADCLAKSHGIGGIGVSDNQEFSERGALRANQSSEAGGGFNSFQHCGGPVSPVNGGVQEFSLHSSGVKGGSGDSNYDCSAAALHITAANGSDSGVVRGNQADDLLIEGKTGLTSHSPLLTSCLRVSSPEEIRLCDPACGSGHMLTHAFDLLYAIYEEQGYQPSRIPSLILEHNLYGMEIDERAGALASFALMMKARERDPRFFSRKVKPHICVYQNDSLSSEEVEPLKWFPRKKEERSRVEHDLALLKEARHYGSLLRPGLSLAEVEQLLETIREEESSGGERPQKVLWGQDDLSSRAEKILEQIRYLARKYHVVVANPPYMGGGNMNEDLKNFAKKHYPRSKSDLFAMFMERGLELVETLGFSAMVTMQSWMFLSSYEKLRSEFFSGNSLVSMVHMANMVMGIAFGTSATIWKVGGDPNFKGTYCYVEYEDIGKNNTPKEFPPRNERNEKAVERNPDCGWFYRASAEDFKKIPGSPIVYWVPTSLAFVFSKMPTFSSVLEAREGLTTGKNDDFVRFQYEVSSEKIGRNMKNREEAACSRLKWFPYNKGGDYRKWYGNDFFVVNWENDGEILQTRKHPSGNRLWAHNFNLEFIFRSSISWSDISTKGLSVRVFPEGYLFDATGLSAFDIDKESCLFYVSAICNSKAGSFLSNIINQTYHFKSGDFSKVPLVHVEQENVEERAKKLFDLSFLDWNSYETSWDFTTLPLLTVESEKHEAESKGEDENSSVPPSASALASASNFSLPTPHFPLAFPLSTAYATLRARWLRMTLEMQRLEEENNRIFIEAYGLQEELTPEVPLEEITLTCNPYYRYGKKVGSGKCEVESKSESGNPVGSGKCEVESKSESENPLASAPAFASNFPLSTSHFPLAPAPAFASNFPLSTSHFPLASAPAFASNFSLPTSYFPLAPAFASNFPLDEELESKLLADTMRELISYAVGCIFGRYSLDVPGLILANQGEGKEEYFARVPEPTFPCAEHNALPLLEEAWFAEDMAEQFKSFLKITFGEERFHENLRFLQEALGKDIRSYFLRDFYNDHVKRYKKRPIYWLFSSSEGSFNVLIYLHRYRPDTASLVLNSYLRPLGKKLEARLDHLRRVEANPESGKAEQARAVREQEKLRKMLQEIRSYERDVLLPLAEASLSIDLDDGVKVNYPKFGKALKSVKGLNA